MIDDLPVSVVLPSPLDGRVVAWVERDLGWQVVEPAGSLPPALALSDRPCGRLPWIAIVDGVPDDHDVSSLLQAGAEDVIGWPRDRDRMALIATRIDTHRPMARRGTHLSVGGVAGGVGTSTIALAVGGVMAWGGAAALVVGGDALVALAGAGGPHVADGAHVAVAGVPRLSVAGRHADAAAVAWTGDVVVRDVGTRVTAETTLVVARPDAALRRAAEAGRPVVVNGELPLRAHEIRRVLGRSPVAQLPWSVRVARAGVLGRVPASLPGRWLRALGAGMRRLEGWSS